jgi:class 3 adenylate cyclase
MEPRSERLLVALTRVPCSTKACAASGDAAWLAALQAYYAIAAQAAGAADGRFVKAMGDGVLLAFPAERAEAAVAALRELQERGTTLWRHFDERCHVQVKGRVLSVLAGLLGAPGEERFDVVGDELNKLFKSPWQDFDVAL